MTGESRVTMHKGAAALFGVALVLAGAGASYLTTPRGAGRHEPMSTRPAGDLTAGPASGHRPPATAIPASTGPLPDLVVALTTDAVERAGIVTAPVVAGRSGGDIRLPGVVEPNAYKRVVVTPLVAGRVTRVSAELGATVRRGQTIAQIYSPELAHAET